MGSVASNRPYVLNGSAASNLTHILNGHRVPYFDKITHFLDLPDLGYLIFTKTTKSCPLPIK